MRGYEEMRGRVVGWGAFFHPFCFFLRSSVCGKVQKDEGPTRKLAGEPVQGYERDYEILIELGVDWFDGFYPYLFLEAKFSRCEGRVVEFRKDEANSNELEERRTSSGRTAREKGFEGSCGAFLERVGSYEGSMSYGGYGS